MTGTSETRALTELKQKLSETWDLTMIHGLLDWDQSTYMPPGGGPARARQSALIAGLAHERRTDREVGRLLDRLRPYEESLPYDSDDASLIRVARRAFERASRVPPAFMAELSRHFNLSYQAWAVARPQNDFAGMAPLLQKTIDLSRRYADYFSPYDHIADPLIAEADYGVTAAEVTQLFGRLRERLAPLVRAIVAMPPADDACLKQHYPRGEQWAINESILRSIGYDFERGRLDVTHHPFMTKFSLGDVRITTRVDEHDLGYALFSTIHEAGHAMYELGIDPAFEGTPLADGASSSVHESQSRLWENFVSRSLPFWQFFLKPLKAAFPAQLGGVDLETFYRAINRVERSLIRTEADEVTYNLHVMIRFDLELALLEGRLAVKDLPDAWNARYAADLGVAPPDDRDGVLQDVHWYAGFVGGAFQGYTLGNILCGQLHEAALVSHPSISADCAQGNFEALHAWLGSEVHRHGAKFTTAELVQRITNGPLRIEPYLAYLEAKYVPLYGLD
jgi:carboxypeptidase Taq